MTMREAFEKHTGYRPDRLRNGYRTPLTNFVWLTWQASFVYAAARGWVRHAEGCEYLKHNCTCGLDAYQKGATE